MEKLNYPLSQLILIKKKRFELATKVLEEKKTILKREEDLLLKVKKERDKAQKHKDDKLKQLRDSLDEGEKAAKIIDMKRYLKLTKEKLADEEIKVAKQQKNVAEALKNVEIARQDLFQKQKDLEKLDQHKVEWQKEIDYIYSLEEDKQLDEISASRHIKQKQIKKKKQ
jgi:hypothetical protein